MFKTKTAEQPSDNKFPPSEENEPKRAPSHDELIDLAITNSIQVLELSKDLGEYRDLLALALAQMSPVIADLQLNRGRFSDGLKRIPASKKDRRFHEVLDRIVQLQSNFHTLPAEIRRFFNNDATLYIHFLAFPGNKLTEIRDALPPAPPEPLQAVPGKTWGFLSKPSPEATQPPENDGEPVSEGSADPQP